MADKALRIAVFGAGGHGKVVIDAVLQNPALSLVCIIDDAPRNTCGMLLGHAVAGGRDILLAERSSIDGVIVAIGNNRVRRETSRWLATQGLPRFSVIHPAAVVSPFATVGIGTLIMPGAIVNAEARIGEDVIINTRAIVEHDCVVSNGVHLAPGSILCGGVEIGDETLIGAGAVIVPGIRVGAHLLVKAGSLISRNVMTPT
jgi:sugar O-acyltransferase (sialic acid O-acetyltransferase NeuD family)